MLNYVKKQNKIKVNIPLFGDIRQFELQSFVRPGPAHCKSLGRYLVSNEETRAIHLLLELLEHLSSTTPNIADCSRGQAMTPDQSQDLFCFPRRFLDVPVRVCCRICSARVYILETDTIILALHTELPAI
jgi:hypothetical protein